MDRKQFCGACLSWLCLLPGLVSAQGAYNLHEKGIERLNEASKIAPLSVDTLFGEQVSRFNGGAEFFSVDISVPGNSGLPVELRRVLKVDDRSKVNGFHLGGFAEWDLDLPRLSSEAATAKGWRPSGGTVAQRCSVPGPLESASTVAVEDYWNGYQLHIPGAGDQPLLMSPSPSLPAASGGPYPWITKGMWRIACKSPTKNGYAGQAFLALSPNGVRYHLDWVVSKAHSAVNGELNSHPVARQVVHFLVSRMEDRFGNWVDYTYAEDKLLSITSNDSRQITLTWSGSTITSATSSAGNWSYTYAGGKLSRVTRPDSSRWSYASTGALSIAMSGWSPPLEDPTGCPDSLEEPTGNYALSITTPSGATAQYVFQVRQHYRHNIPEHACFINTPQYWFMKVPRFHWSLTLTTKTVTGPGLQPMTWSYSYGGGPIAFDNTKQNTIVAPDGAFTRYTFGTGFNLNEGQLLRTETGSSSSNILRADTSIYVSDTEVQNHPFPNQVGVDPKPWSDLLSSSRLRPLKQSSVTQQARSFATTVTQFDVFGRPVHATKTSTPTP